jgi:hypothetical protein
LAFRTGKEVVEAQAMLDLLARIYTIFAEWREAEVDTVLLRVTWSPNTGGRSTSRITPSRPP